MKSHSPLSASRDEEADGQNPATELLRIKTCEGKLMMY